MMIASKNSTGSDGLYVIGTELHESARVRVSRLACPSRASCPGNEFAAVDVQLGTGTVVSLKKGAAARYNEGSLPLEIVRVEVKPAERPQ